MTSTALPSRKHSDTSLRSYAARGLSIQYSDAHDRNGDGGRKCGFWCTANEYIELPIPAPHFRRRISISVSSRRFVQQLTALRQRYNIIPEAAARSNVVATRPVRLLLAVARNEGQTTHPASNWPPRLFACLPCHVQVMVVPQRVTPALLYILPHSSHHGESDFPPSGACSGMLTGFAEGSGGTCDLDAMLIATLHCMRRAQVLLHLLDQEASKQSRDGQVLGFGVENRRGQSETLCAASVTPS
ncbi:hypothetical protein K461DRAFT_302318 [Myriangium duriaei CBS 260.36]|uniref:Uncharacterized protein n=1 Tax=Myriangium duriaei CBS 260.36 TaxID=1168546 RepID=A0A9P4IQ00_9PEZI|nr:hypothetical protein K461DRAFT_302318 [Myriangium duriaei CBS 260.36]